MRFLIDENIPRALTAQIVALGFFVIDVRDTEFRGKPDEAVMQLAIAYDAIIITRDRGFAVEKSWPQEFSAGVIFVNLSHTIPAKVINTKLLELITQRSPES